MSTPLRTNDLRTKDLLSRLAPAAPPTRIRRLLLFLAVLGLSSFFLVYLVFSSSFSASTIFPASQNPLKGQYYAPYTPTEVSTSPWFRDSHPVLHTRLFLARAQAEIRARNLDTCDGKLSAPMVDGYVDAALLYCAPNATSPAPASITCFPARAPDSPNAWWPYAQSFCASRNLAHTLGFGGSGHFTGACGVTQAGAQLGVDMGREGFVGKDFQPPDADDGVTECGEMIDHPVLFVPRQDRWNPFHVGEDLVTTFLALTIFSRHTAAATPSLSALFSGAAATSKRLWTSLPAAYAKYTSGNTAEFARMRRQLAEEVRGTAGLQLVFMDEYLPTQSLFAPLYDRMGAFTARRTAAEALGDGGPTCFSTAFHSVGAGASLLSGTGVGKEWGCASELVWGASLWLRWLWGLESLPGGADFDLGEDLARRGVVKREQEKRHEPPVQVLFLSREKFDAVTKHQNKHLTGWQEARHITNEHELVEGLRKGLAGLCRVVTDVGGGSTAAEAHTPGAYDCAYTDTDMLPGAWGVGMHPREARALGISLAVTPEGPTRPDLDSGADAGAGSSEGALEEGVAARAPAPAPAPSASAARALRFSTLDPTTAALPAQLGAVGRADVVVSVHAGALGLMLFMPTGRASVVELVPTGANGNYHFHNMAAMMGMQYEHVNVGRNVDVPKVVQIVQRVVGGHLAA